MNIVKKVATITGPDGVIKDGWSGHTWEPRLVIPGYGNRYLQHSLQVSKIEKDSDEGRSRSSLGLITSKQQRHSGQAPHRSSKVTHSNVR